MSFNPKLSIIDLVRIAGVWQLPNVSEVTQVPPVLAVVNINEELQRVDAAASTTVPELSTEGPAAIDNG